MATASTKQRRNKRASAVQSNRSAATAAMPATSGANVARLPQIPEPVWRLTGGAVLLVGAVLRFVALELKPLHHDEGVNGFFVKRLVQEGIYQYDPANYHGPTLYYLTLPFTLLAGLNTFAIRSVPALFGLGLVWLTLCLRRRIGSIGALAAAALIAVSPGAVYMSRYYIHETLFVFFTLGLVVAALRYYDTGKPLYLLLASTATALLFATKETAFISVGVLALAWGVAWSVRWVTTCVGWNWGNDFDGGAWRGDQGNRVRPADHPAARGASMMERFGRTDHVVLLWLAAIVLFLFINVLFYSSFFTYAKGIDGALETFKIWTQTGTKDHTKPFLTYVTWLWQEEAGTLLLGGMGATLALLGARNRFAVFAGAWAFGILAAYSLVPYKTPWLAINFIVPLTIIGGYAVNVFYEWGRKRVPVWSALTLAPALAAVLLGSYQAVRLNFYHYDDDRYPYVYAHTWRDFLTLVSEVERLAARAGTGKETAVSIASPDYWPLPWYLRDYKHVGFHGRLGAYTEPIVIGNESQASQLEAQLGARYQKVGTVYALRPGVNLVIYAHRELTGL
ncbi:MAG: TIGR03663 family protein [Acidobacteriota bacterium]|nr:TIGR03663 family protein [Acidobacteriota bacterium]